VGGNSIDRAQRISRLYESCSTYLLLMTYLVLPPVSLKQYQGLNCQSIRGGSFLRIDTSIDCDSEAYVYFSRINVLCIAIYMTIPPVWLYLLWKRRQRLNPPTSDLKLAYHLRDSDEQLATLHFLFVAYQPRFYYFEPLKCENTVIFIYLSSLSLSHLYLSIFSFFVRPTKVLNRFLFFKFYFSNPGTDV
jgi:hypothetical protein